MTRDVRAVVRAKAGRDVGARVALLVCCALGFGLFVASLQYPLTVDGRVGPGMYPLAAALVITIAALVSLVSPHPDDDPGYDDADALSDEEFGDAAWRVPVLIGALVAYVAVVEHLGHLITSCVLGWVCLRVVGGRPWWQQIAIALALGIGTAELFARLGVPLPLGVLLS